jgi:hypothetical protein
MEWTKRKEIKEIKITILTNVTGNIDTNYQKESEIANAT